MTAIAAKSPNPGNMLFENIRHNGADSSVSRLNSPLAQTGTPTSLSVSPSVPTQDLQQQQHPEDGIAAEDLPEPICGGCKKMIDEESADAGVIHFATQLWHVECFRCAKCRNPVTTDRDDILLLSDGHPICGQCNYSCQICNMPIMEEAIMTGDESYHASCFVCRSCQTPIAELVFAKTSQGIYCMKCHNQRVARSRRHAEKKRAAAAAATAAAANAASSGLPAPGNASIRSESKKSPTTPTFSGSEYRSPSVASLTPNSPNRKEAAASNADADRQAKINVSASSSSGTSLSPFLASGSSSNLTKTSSAGIVNKRPLNAPPPLGLRPMKKEGSSRPSTAELNGSQAGPAQSSSSSKQTYTPNVQQSSMSKMDGEIHSPLLAGAMEQAAATEKRRQQAERENTRNQLVRQTPSSAEPQRASDEKGVSTSTDERHKDLAGLGIGGLSSDLRKENGDVDKTSSLSLSRDTHTGADEDDPPQPNKVQLKRASRLNIADHTPGEAARLSRTFSFYDPDIVGLMDSFGRFDSSEEFSLDSVAKKNVAAQQSQDAKQAKSDTDDELPQGVTDDMQDGDDTLLAASSREKNRRGSETSLSRLSESMRKSIQRSRDGHVNMDTDVLEGMLDELDATRERMKSLQRKYERIRRASQQAAQGFSTAREEYEQEVQARYDAEADMLNLKRQLHLQASRLAEMATEKRQQEDLQRRNVETKSSLQDMQRELGRLRVERELTLAEVAELLAMQDGRGMSSSNNEDVIKRNLIHRLDGVKNEYRVEIEQLLNEREQLSLEIEELRQSRDVFAEETQSLNARNEELNGALALLQRRVEHAQAAERLAVQRQLPVPSATSQPSSGRSGAGAFGFGFGANKQVKTPTSAASTATTANTTLDMQNSQAVELPAHVAYASPVPVTKIETAPKKFKWMKAPKLTAEHARNAGQHIAAALPGMPPAVPQKNGVQSNATSIEGRPLSPISAQNSLQSTQATSVSTASAHHQYKHSQDHVGGNTSSSGTQNGGTGSAGDIIVKEHLFQPFNVLRPVRCFACQKNMWGQSELKCSFCNHACHVRCLHNLPTSCVQPFSRSDEAPPEPAGPPMFGRRLTEQVQSESPRNVPSVVQKCVDVVEVQGMDYEGIYRKSGGTSQSKIITQLFEKGQPFNLDDRDRFNDISAITSVLKNYFRELPEPLLTFELHERFIECAESKSRDAAQKQAKMRELVHTLPKEHFDTLKYLVDHLHRVQARAEENRMSSRNLGVVFGPTLMRSSDPTQEFAHMGGKAMTIELLIDNPTIFEG